MAAGVAVCAVCVAANVGGLGVARVEGEAGVGGAEVMSEKVGDLAVAAVVAVAAVARLRNP